MAFLLQNATCVGDTDQGPPCWTFSDSASGCALVSAFAQFGLIINCGQAWIARNLNPIFPKGDLLRYSGAGGRELLKKRIGQLEFADWTASVSCNPFKINPLPISFNPNRDDK